MRNMVLTNRRLLALALLVAGCGAVSGAVGWAFARLVLDLQGDSLTLWVSVVSGAGVLLGGVVGQPLFDAALSRHLEQTSRAPSAETLDRWQALLQTAVLRRRVRGERSQREQMLRGNVLIDPVIAPQITLHSDASGRPRVRVQGPHEAWSAVIDRWAHTEGRMVILGDPGYGKTLAALALISHVTQSGSRVADLFPLVDWHAWAAGREDAAIEEWLPQQLTQTYPELPLSVARALVAQDRLVPVFDGLDELPEAARADCRDALEAYAGRSTPFRPFVVTSRQREYLALTPKWVGADRHVALAGLRRDQILAVLHESVGATARWATVIAALEDGDEKLLALLRSPLRLGAAIEAYEHRDARELIALAYRADAHEHLWDLLLESERNAFPGADMAQVRRWLSFLAASLQSHDRQRFWLHELYLYAAPHERRRFFLLSCTVVTVVQVGQAAMVGSAFLWMLCGLFVIAIAIVYRNHREEPLAQTVARRMRLRHYIRALPDTALLGVIALLGFSAISFPCFLAIELVQQLSQDDPLHVGSAALSALVLAAFGGAFGAAAVCVSEIAEVGASFVAEEPPAHLAGRGPAAVLAATRNAGLVVAAATAIMLALPIVVFWDDIDLTGVIVPLVVIPIVNGYASGLGAWAYFHWARLQLARADLLPRELTAFLEWASQAGWLRANDAYEFRHKELLDHLAGKTEAIGAGNLSLAEAQARRGFRGISSTQARRGNRLMRAHDYGGALAAYDAAIAAASDDPRLRRMRCLALDHLQRHSELLDEARRALRLDPTDAASHCMLAIAYQRVGDCPSALVHHERSVELEPDSAQYRLNLAIMLRLLGRFDDQLRVACEALARWPEHDGLHRERASALKALGRHEERLRAAQELARGKPKELTTQLLLLAAHRRLGNGAEAGAARRSVVDLVCDARAEDAQRLGVADMLNTNGFCADALRIGAGMTADGPHRLRFSCLLAQASSTLGLHAEGDRHLGVAASLARTWSDYNHLAVAYTGCGRHEDAMRALDRTGEDESPFAMLAFTRAEISLARADVEATRHDLSVAFQQWAAEHRTGAGDPAWMCRLLWTQVPTPHHAAFAELLIDAYADHGLVWELTEGLVAATPTCALQCGYDDARLARWCEAWSRDQRVGDAVDAVRRLAASSHAEIT